METNETIEHAAPENGIILTYQAQAYLREGGKWAGFLGVVGFIICGIILISALFVGTLFSAMGNLIPGSGDLPAGMGIGVALLLILIDVLYFFFALYLYQFSVRIKKGIVYTDTIQVTQALSRLKSFFKLAGIVTIVVLCLYVIEIIAVTLIGIAAAHH